MMYHQVSYDLNKEKNYDKLFEGIKSYGTWCHALDSLWIIKTEQTATQVFNNLRPLIDDNDHLFVSQVNSNFMIRASGEVIDWINKQNF